VRRANEAINQKIVAQPLLHRDRRRAPGALPRWEVLKLIKDLQGFLARQPASPRRSGGRLLEVLGRFTAGGGRDLLIDEQATCARRGPEAILQTRNLGRYSTP